MDQPQDQLSVRREPNLKAIIDDDAPRGGFIAQPPTSPFARRESHPTRFALQYHESCPLRRSIKCSLPLPP